MAKEFNWDDVENESSSSAANEQRESSEEKSKTQDTNQRAKDIPTHKGYDLGEAPELPPIFFTYDPTKNKLEVRDRRGNVKADFDVMTVKGASAYEIWKEGRVKGEDTSYTAYLQEQKGKDGKNAYEEWKEWQGAGTDRSQEAYWAYFKGAEGQSAFDLWKEVHGEKTNSTPDDFFEYLKGKNGKDAFEVWQDLGYKNSSREDFFKWIASLVETQKGENGTTYIPHIENGELFFVNDVTGDKTNPYPIVGKDGTTYYPHIDGYELYFTDDIAGNNPEVLPRVNLRGAQGGTFEPIIEGTTLHFDDHEGHTTKSVDLHGKDAFELWKEHEHKPNATFEEYLEFFKGQNVKSNHSYLDIKDYTCPVQTIDTDLIANVLDSDHSPDELIKLRQGDIDRLRKEGDERNNKCYWFFNGSLVYTNWAGWFKEFSWWCAGADRPLLRMCKGDHSKYTGIGTVILFTALMAWFSSFVAMQLVFKNNWIAATFATFWSMMIFFLDRFITNTMYSDGKVSISKDELLGGLPRILIAIFLGIVISAPLELKIFDKEIKETLHTELKNEAQKAKEKDDSHIKAHEELKTAMNAENDARNKFNKTANNPNDSAYYTSNNTIVNAGTKNEQYWDRNKNQYVTSKVSAGSKVQTTMKYDINLFYAKCSRDSMSLENAIQNTKKKRDELAKTDSVFLSRYLENNDDKINDKGLYSNLHALHSIAMNGYHHWTWCGETLDTILHAWWWYLFNSAIGLIMLLFILIDISPVLYKMMLADGVYDNYLHQEKLLAQDKIRLSLARMLRNIEKGELKSLSPFIMGKIYRKLMKFSASKDGKYNGEDKDYKQHINWENAGGLNTRISETNKEVFETVLDYKRRIVLASYAAWYRDMRDAMIGAKDDEDGEKITPDSHFHEKKEDSQVDDDSHNQENSNDEAETINPTENTETV